MNALFCYTSLSPCVEEGSTGLADTFSWVGLIAESESFIQPKICCFVGDVILRGLEISRPNSERTDPLTTQLDDFFGPAVGNSLNFLVNPDQARKWVSLASHF